jgi:fatty-acyl-CoA synthase
MTAELDWPNAGARLTETKSRGSNLSHVRGASHPPLTQQTIGDMLETACARWHDRTAIVARHQAIYLTYGDLQRKVDALAAGLLALGLAPGDRVGLWGRNSAEWVTIQLAAARAGLIFVGFNPAYRAADLAYALNKLGCRALLLARRSGREDFLATLSELAPELASAVPGALHAARLPQLRHVIVLDSAPEPGKLAYAALEALGREAGAGVLRAVATRLRHDDPINIQMTSGTTGAAKGATLSHAMILNNAFLTGETLRLTERDRICLPVPLYHSFGMVAGILSALSHGAAIVLPAEGFQPLQTLQAIAEERCTAVLGVPTMFLAMMDHPAFARFDLSSLRTGIMSCSPCPIEVMRRAIAEMNLGEITTAYGMTETSPISFQSAPDDPLERRVGTAGRVHPHVEAKVVDAAGRTVPIGTAGELMIRGYSVMLGYWDDAANTRATVDDEGWLRTGDLAVIDAEGYGRIVGRLKDTIIRGGENIAPREIEELLYRHPKIREVHVVGLPDARHGEEICAWVRLRDGEIATVKEIRDFCRGSLARYKVPRYVQFVDGFPMTANGKVQKFVMRERSLAALKTAKQARPIVASAPRED